MNTPEYEIASFGGGCFWCLEAVFERLDGVVSVQSGYCGGTLPKPTYRDICRGDTGHAEVVRITFDPDRIGFSTLLEVFFATHDPTTPNRQGHDVGTQYRSVIVCHTPEQRLAAERAISVFNEANLEGRRAVTELLSEQTFYPAEDYHRQYYREHPDQAYCQIVISPKLNKLRQSFNTLLRTDGDDPA